MKYRLFTLSLVGMFALGLMVSNVCLTYAQGQGATSSNYKIGIVDVQKVMDNYNKRTVEVQKLEAEVNKKKEEIEKLRETFQNELKQFQEDRANMTEEERADREAELDNHALTDQCVVEISRFPRLQRLTLSGVPVSASALEMLGQMKTLKALDLRNADVSRDAMDKMAAFQDAHAALNIMY